MKRPIIICARCKSLFKLRARIFISTIVHKFGLTLERTVFNSKLRCTKCSNTCSILCTGNELTKAGIPREKIPFLDSEQAKNILTLPKGGTHGLVPQKEAVLVEGGGSTVNI